MGLKFRIESKKLNFLFEAGTSRGVLKEKLVWILNVSVKNNPLVIGIGEAGPLKGLSIDDIPDFEKHLIKEVKRFEKCAVPKTIEDVLELVKTIPSSLPSVKFGIETALLDLINGGVRKIFDNAFYAHGAGIQINGLVWMGKSELMQKRLSEKINSGFKCIKIKIGAIGFDKELELLTQARAAFDVNELELRVDANGAFSYEDAQPVLQELKKINVHSIEQPIKAGQRVLMAKLCRTTPVPIALDEELIGINSYEDKKELLIQIKPQYIILKPALLGGFNSCKEWIEIAESLNIGWWITSALESNVGLNAICQFASHLNVTLPQGLGTGNLYSNNIASPLEINGDIINYNHTKTWDALLNE